MKRVVGTGLVAMAAAATLSAENWPQWRGPAKNGVSAEKGLPLKWSTTENITWKVEMPGRSGSTPIIWGETIFLNIGTADGRGDLELWALDRADGRIRWKKHLAGGNHLERKQNMSSPSPVTDGQTVWVMTCSACARGDCRPLGVSSSGSGHPRDPAPRARDRRGRRRCRC